MEHYGVRGAVHQWFASYLSNREQFVSVNRHNSSLKKVSCGVPQGSVLGPLLFFIYINDLPNATKSLSFFLFADDTNIYFESDDIEKLTKKINKELVKLKKWLDCNKLSLNVNKTNFVMFYSPKKPISDNIFIKFGKKVIERVKYVKFLGILMDEHLSYKYHIQELHKKLSKTSGIFFKISHQLSKEILVSLCYSLFSSLLSYGLLVCGLTCESYKLALFRLQKKVVKCIHSEPLHTHSSPLFKSSNLLKLDDLLKVNILSFVYKATNNLSPSCFQDYFTYNSNIHGYRARQVERGDLYKKYHRSSLWNNIPICIRVSQSQSLFRTKLKAYFVDQY